MRAVVQRVSRASVTVAGEVVGRIGQGLLVLLGVEADDTRVAVCTDCHGSHDVKKVSDPSAAVFALNIPNLCSGCHGDAQRMEPYGIPTDQFDVYSDSALVVNTLTQWAKGWERNGWRRRDGEVKNLELVREAYELARERPLARIQWIRAHDGSRWNEYADSLSTAYQRAEV